jgi:hypothetical protein
MTGLIPLAQEWEATFFIVGAVLLVVSMALRGASRILTGLLGGLIFLVTLVVTVLTFHAPGPA